MASGALTVLATAALAGVATPAAQAADDCPNAAVRAQQNATHLPNCMAYEKVTPDEKGGAVPWMQDNILPMAITDDGDSALYNLNAAVANPKGFITGGYRAVRGATGWETTSILPAFNAKFPSIQEEVSIVATSPDHERYIFETRYPFHPNDKGKFTIQGSRDLYAQDADGELTWLIPDPSVEDTSFNQDVEFVGASRELDRVLLSTTRKFDPRTADASTAQLYVSGPQGIVLASVLPNGDLPVNLPASIPITEPEFNSVQAISSDGERVVFTEQFEGDDQRVYVRFNADDPATALTREVAVGPNGETCAPVASARTFRRISADGTQLTFRCAASEQPNTLPAGTYVRDLDGGPAAVQRSVVHDRPAPIEPGEFDGSYRQVESPNGEYLLFDSSGEFGLPGIDAGPLSASQTYLLSRRTGELSCVSCRQDGQPTEGFSVMHVALEGIAGSAKAARPVTDGGRVAFTTSSALVPEDTNGTQDAYAWIDGRAVLLSAGRGRVSSAALGTSADGRSFFVQTADVLTRDDDDGQSYDIYVARENGGFLLADEPAGCAANCQAPGPERPSLPGLGSIDFVGSGNLVEEATSPGASAPRATASLTASRSVRGKSITVRVKVSRAGSIRVSGVGLRQATVKAKKAGTYRVTVRLSAFGSAQQKRRGRLSTQLKARFTPESGPSVQTRKSVTFTTAKKGGR